MISWGLWSRFFPRGFTRTRWFGVLAAVCLLSISAWGQVPLTLAGGNGPVAFPNTAIGQTVAQSVTLSANATVSVADITVAGDFTLDDSSCKPPLQLQAGGSCVLGINFTPTAPGERWAPLVITDDKGVKYAFALDGNGIGPDLVFTPGIVSTVAGTGVSGYGGDGGSGTSAQLNFPMGVARDSAGNLFIADYLNNVIRKLAADGSISTVAGNGTPGYSGDGGPATSAQLAYPSAVALDGAGNLYIADFWNSCVRKVDANDIISTVVTAGFLVIGVAADSAGNVYYSSSYEGVWKVDTQGVSTRIAGNGTAGFSGDGGPATAAQTFGVTGLALDSPGNLYLAEVSNSDVRKVDTNGIITTVAGNQQFGFAGDGGPATSAQFNGPSNVRVDAAGDLYIADASNNRIRKVNGHGVITTIAGGGNYGYGGDGGVAFGAQFASPAAIALDENGNLLVADTGNSVVRQVNVTSTTLDFGTVALGQTSGPVTVLVSNSGNADLDIGAITVNGPFALQGTCSAGTSVKPGSDCSLQVSFTPPATGSFTGTVSLSEGAADSQHRMSLKGEGYVVPVASQLVLMAQFDVVLPLNGNLGVVAVNAADPNGYLATGFNGAVSLQLQGPAGFTAYSAQVNAISGTATFDLSAVTLNVPGSYTLSASSAALISAQASFLVQGVGSGGPDFSVSISKQSLSVASSGAVTLDAVIAPVNGFSGAITMSCSGLPANSSCTFMPASVRADGTDSPAHTVLTLSTGVATAADNHPEKANALGRSPALVSFGIAGLILFPSFRKRSIRVRQRGTIVAIMLLGILIAGLVGCGGIGQAAPQTPAGNYSVTVTAMSADVSRNATFTLTVR